MKNRTILSFAAGSAVAVAGLIGGTVAMATDNGSTESQAVGRSHGDVDRAGEYVAALAKNLGIDEQTLRDAMKKTSLEFLDQAVADGKLTQEQADSLRSKIESGEGAMFGFGGKGVGHDGGKGGRGGMAAPFKADGGLAEFLGVDAGTLRSEMTAGSTLGQIAEAHGKSRDELKAFLSSEMDERLAEAVSNGKLTQDQADDMKARYAENLDAMIDQSIPSRGPGGDHGGRGFHGAPGGTGSTSTGTSQVQ